MKSEEFNALVAATQERTGQLLIAKGAEYAGNADRLANFKRNAEKQGQTVLEVWQTYWGKHIDSINTYMARVKHEATRAALHAEVDFAIDAKSAGETYNADPARFQKSIAKFLPGAISVIDAELSEPIEGRFDDNINYSMLCQAILAELRNKNTVTVQPGDV